ncbi:MAG TPA: hypothetical protein VJL85_02005 [Gaiellaceae bacterium]|nr:hypothetical protein [Gaiellaceae bacterium]
MNKADQLVDRAADRLREIADRAAAQGGLAANLADELAEDAAFLRRLKPSLIVARAKGEAPTNLPSGSGTPASPLLGAGSSNRRGKGPSPFLVVGAALVAGIVLAKLIDWRGHAHPRD